ncbi:glycosyltransferase family 87 protein [Altericista sp. CCNU0014]|uniref:glycosyltransferase family 87 protein n=1 Tax=Altericista sp. CCNU0014 TaxID=3082949 RepID=UPI00384BF0B6
MLPLSLATEKTTAMDSRKILAIILSILAIGIMIFSFSSDLENTLNYGGIDLRARVVGARLLAEGKDPYFFGWQEGMSEKLLDPRVKPGSVVSRVTMPPNVLTLHSISSASPYFHQRIIWLLAQWASFLAIIALFLKQNKALSKRCLIVFIGLCFLNSYFWRLHVERGQIYILYVLLLSIASYLFGAQYKKRKRLKGELFGGFILGFLVSLRPFAVLAMIPFTICRRWNVLVGSMFGAFFGLSIPLVLAKPSIWNSYFKAMGLLARYNDNHGDYSKIETFGNQNTIVYPNIIEGLQTLALVKDIPAINSSLSLVFEKINFANRDLVLSAILVFFIFFSSIFLIGRYKNKLSTQNLFLAGILLCLTSEFFFSAPRYSYNDVQWILPILTIVTHAEVDEILVDRKIAILFLGLILSMGFLDFIPKFLFFSLFAIAYYAISSTISLFDRSLKFDAEMEAKI